MAVSQLGYLGIGASDLDKWLGYATSVLGLELSDRGDDGTLYLRMDEHHHRLIVQPGDADDLIYVGWQTRNRDEFEQTKASLYEAGVEVIQGSKADIDSRDVVDLVRFDLGGVGQEVYYGPRLLFEKPFRPSVAHSGFNTGELGMGHFGLAVDNEEEAHRIITQGLGMKVSDHFMGAERFFHCNPREHTIGILPIRPGMKKLPHFMIEANTLRDVGRCLDRVQDAGFVVQSTLGEHNNDHMVSFYMTSPSGFGVEYGWNGRTVDDATWVVGKYAPGNIWGHRRPNAGGPGGGPAGSPPYAPGSASRPG